MRRRRTHIRTSTTSTIDTDIEYDRGDRGWATGSGNKSEQDEIHVPTISLLFSDIWLERRDLNPFGMNFLTC